MTKTEWLKLADAYIAEVGYWHELYKLKIEIAKKHGLGTDFIGTDYFDGPMTSVIEELLGDDFSYWHYNCEKSFNGFNEKVTLADGSHPAVHSLEDLYDFWKGEGNEN